MVKNKSAKSDLPPDPVSERLRDMVTFLGGKDAAARVTGKSEAQIRRYEDGDSEPPFEVVAKLADKAGRSLDWVAGGAPVAEMQMRPAPPEDFLMIPKFEIRASAGRGKSLVPDEIYGPSGFVGFRKEWLRSIGVPPDKAEFLIAEGDSMEPLIRDGDLMLINRAIRSIVTAGIYAVTWSGMMVVKRCYIRSDGSLLLKSENPVYPEEVITPDRLHDVIIEGRIRWAGRTM